MHGGRKGFHKVVWQGKAGSGEQVILKYLSRDGEESFPGNLDVEVRYSLGATNELRIDYEATTDKPTILNLTNHSYFNLAGEGSGDVLDHIVTIEADHFTPEDATQVPTGEIRPVAGTPFDFTTPRPVGERIRSDDEQMIIARGYDHNWVLRKPEGAGPRLAARAHEPVTGRILEVLTDAPGLQLYAGNSLNGAAGRPLGPGLSPERRALLRGPALPRCPEPPEFSLRHPQARGALPLHHPVPLLHRCRQQCRLSPPRPAGYRAPPGRPPGFTIKVSHVDNHRAIRPLGGFHQAGRGGARRRRGRRRLDPCRCDGRALRAQHHAGACRAPGHPPLPRPSPSTSI